MAVKQTAGRRDLGEFAPKFAELNDDILFGEVWSRERIAALKEEVAASGLHISGIESVNIHDAIKTGSPERDMYIDN